MSSSNYENSFPDSNNCYSNDPFGSKSNINHSENHLSSFETNEDESNFYENEPEYLILKDSTFELNIEFNKEKNKADIKYEKITYDNKNGKCETQIEEIKGKSYITNYKLKNSYDRFLDYLQQVEQELESNYKISKAVKLSLKFDIINRTNIQDCYDAECKLKILDNRENDEFRDENFLNDSNHTGLSCMIDEIKRDVN